MSQEGMNRYLAFQRQFDNLTLRERLLTTIAGLVVVLFGGYFLFIEPAQMEIKTAKRRLNQLNQTQLSLDAQLQAVEKDLAMDPNLALDANIGASKQAIKQLDSTLAAQVYNLVPAAAMPSLLEQVLSQSRGVVLLEMVSLPPTRMMAVDDDTPADTSANEPDENGLFQHGVRLTLQGSYFDIQKYLARTESLSWQFYWKVFNYQVKDFPLAEVEVELYTLSTSKAFIGVGDNE